VVHARWRGGRRRLRREGAAAAARAPVGNRECAGQGGADGGSPCRPDDGEAEAELRGGGGVSGSWRSVEEVGEGDGVLCSGKGDDMQGGNGWGSQ
jgi:hypothetical protein